jgi:hypothetical protein
MMLEADVASARFLAIELARDEGQLLRVVDRCIAASLVPYWLRGGTRPGVGGWCSSPAARLRAVPEGGWLSDSHHVARHPQLVSALVSPFMFVIA